MINLEYFKDKIFDLLNEENTMDIQDMDLEDIFQCIPILTCLFSPVTG